MLKHTSTNQHSKKIKPKLMRIFPTLSLLGLSGIALVAISPINFATNDNVYAETSSTSGGSYDHGISLSISGDPNASVDADMIHTTYRSHIVTAHADSITSYALSIAYADGSTSLKNSNSGSYTVGNVDAAGVLGSDIQPSTWGWGWSDHTQMINSGITYKPMLTTQTVMKTDNSLVNHQADVSGKLAFAVRFGNGAVPGHYQANVLVSFVVEPHTLPVSFADYSTMQELTKAKCDNEFIPIGMTGRLRDTRDNMWYWVTKQQDGLCWMTQNLDYNGGGTKVESPAGTFTPSSYAVYYDPGYYYCNTSGCNLTTSTNDEHDAQGNYYTYGAASNVCPTGWGLPTTYATQLSGLSKGSEAAKDPYYLTYAGRIDTSNLNKVGSNGRYWLKNSGAFDMYSTSLNNYNNETSTMGLSIRCVAE